MFKKAILVLFFISNFSVLFAETFPVAETFPWAESLNILEKISGNNESSGNTTTPEDENVPDNSEDGLRHGEVILPSTISALIAGVFMIEDLFFNLIDWGDTEIWLKRGTLFSIHIPLYFVSPFQGLIITGISAGCFTVYEFLHDQNVDFFRHFFFTGVLQAGLYSTYIAYKTNRVKARSGVYNDDWRQKTFAAKFSGELGIFGDVYKEWEPCTFLDLMISPFTPENLLDPMVWLLPISGILTPLFTRSHDSAPWTTGTMYVGTWEMSPFAAIPLMLSFLMIESSIVGISEESHFRGFIYEEIGSNYGHIIAKIFDCIYFPAIHISQELFISDFDSLTIARNFLSRSMLTFYMDNLYDRGGLERTVAAHFWIDFSLLFMQWLMVSGTPQEDVSSIMQLLPEVQIRIPLKY